jgi:SpoVK/Ycf46/Vps4 family AAA+-type ATPase
MPTQPVIPQRFAQAVDQHLVFNLVGVDRWPLILGVFGPPGDGKSFQIRTHLERRGVLPVTINAADLESDRAGTPGKLVLSMYKDAGDRIDEFAPAAVIVDDFDTTVGEWEHSTTTVNHQQVLAQLMHLADSPTEAAGRPLRRVPVFITGNDLSKIYPPLRRPGRMRAFPWLVSDDEREEVVAGILADLLQPEEVAGLLAKVPDAPIAFFSDLFVEALALAAERTIHNEAADLVGLIRQAGKKRDEFEKVLSKNKPTSAQLAELALVMWHDRAIATASHLDR